MEASPASLLAAMQHLYAYLRDAPVQSCIGAFLLYVSVCSALRFQRVRSIQRKYPYPDRASYAKMTTQHAWEIQKALFSLEFPYIVDRAYQFALFRTYGIPTISKLLLATKEFSTRERAPKREVDTVVIILEFVSCPPDSERACAAIARLNYIHGVYQRAGKISNDDMLYTLALFVGEPIKFIKKYEWREVTDLETCAMGTFWKAQGDAMHISYEPLEGFKTGWRDGIEWYEDLMRWTEKYEAAHMVPNQVNRDVANETLEILLYDLPRSMHGIGINAALVLMDERLRKSMLFGPPPRIYETIIDSVLQFRKFLLRYLALPRPYMWRYIDVSEKPDKTGRIHREVYATEPWYVSFPFARCDQCISLTGQGTSRLL